MKIKAIDKVNDDDSEYHIKSNDLENEKEFNDVLVIKNEFSYQTNNIIEFPEINNNFI